MQKRGVVVDADDWLPVRDTYPEHPNLKNEPKAKTLGELKKLRYEENLKQIETNNA